ncbi:hypothetical protein BGX30_015053 [Mortierella sp. GBA39]|nr:hypothetical protein BGX30_015053 [Mortierella sp. GBA39]
MGTRGDLGLHRHIAGNEYDRAVFPDAACERQGKTRQKRRNQLRQNDGPKRPESLRPERGGCFFSIPLRVLQHRLHGPHNERNADEHQRDRNAKLRKGHLDAQRLQQRADPAVLRVERSQGDPRYRGRKRKGQVDQRVKQPFTGKLVTHQHPSDQQTQDRVDQGGRRRGQKADFVGGQHPRVGSHMPKFVPAQPCGI